MNISVMVRQISNGYLVSVYDYDDYAGNSTIEKYVPDVNAATAFIEENMATSVANASTDIPF